MARAKRYNWTLMGTSPARVLELAQYWRFGLGQELPEEVDWTQTPQGARFWYLAFLKGDKRAEAALGRMIRQAGEDKAGVSTRAPVIAAYIPPAYDIAKLAISPAHILAHQDTMYFCRKPPMGVHWVLTPQGPAFWYAYFASDPATRDRRVIDCLIVAAQRARALKGGTNG